MHTRPLLPPPIIGMFRAWNIRSKRKVAAELATLASTELTAGHSIVKHGQLSAEHNPNSFQDQFN
jgi:hypothetical protein